ncbi:MAG: class I SAM-dependent methyltransferase [Desulfobacterales bacterium]|nr:class I SAM-dependent methyltransferase [Desulfobacterales bacterium]
MRTGRHPGRGRPAPEAGAAADPAADYYATHYKAYHAETFNIDPTPFLGPFARRLRPGCRVLDVGCGSGRDLAWLVRRGFTAIGFERSPGLADLARQKTGCKVISDDFTRFDFASLAVDALLMAGALVHVPHTDLAAVLGRILPAVTPRAQAPLAAPGCAPDNSGHSGHSGQVYVSLKEGRGRHADKHGRVFYLWPDATLRRLFEDLGLAVVHFRRGPSAVGGSSTWLGYVLQIE